MSQRSQYVGQRVGNKPISLHVPEHKIIGTVAAMGPHAKGLTVGQRVGLGWFADSCLTCEWCKSEIVYSLCAYAVGTIVGRYGAVAKDTGHTGPGVFPLPIGFDPQTAAPLMCGGITVFNPLLLRQVRPTARVGVVGIGGLGHMALKLQCLGL